jgi:hypothetical protein
MMYANFIITADKIYDLQYELLSNNVNNIISNSESDYKTISALGMENVEFYRDATKKGIVQNGNYSPPLNLQFHQREPFELRSMD